METGMLWFDNDPKTALSSKIERAVQYYRQKYGQQPTLCFIHPSMVVGDEKQNLAGVEVRPNRMVLPNHFWVGVGEAMLI
ncbi:MAG: hypothetical protein LDL12_04295 [Anaerolinea sp.]|nr:hypothetical protein [Anaerolinea sp.]